MSRAFLLVALATTTAWLASCAMDSTDCAFDGTCSGTGPTGDGGVTGDANGADVGPGPGRDAMGVGDGPVIIPPTCELAKSPKESPACIEDGVGAFVSPMGKDGAAGTKADPLRTIGEAAKRGKPRVYVCAGTYDVAVALTQPIAIFGGLSCSWEPTGARPKLAPQKGVALKITKVSGAVLIQDIDIVGSADANVPGDSAIAAFVSESNDVTFRNVNLTSGAGTAGATGATTSNYSGTATGGGNASAAAGGTGPTCACLDGVTSSRGGNGAGPSGAGVTNGSAVPAVGGTNGGGSPTPDSCNSGQPGASGAANAGGDGQISAGALSAQGWAAPSMNVPRASNGNPAQGGGGGGARIDVGSAGGGGGCGGCGGGGGEPGRAGGSSFALLSFQSTVIVAAGQLESGAAGIGGIGGAGQAGQSGGGQGAAALCPGGVGGNGAGGSGGGGGAGGHSAAIAFVGEEPTVSAATLIAGPKGPSGPGGKGGTSTGNAGNVGKPGAEGKSQNTLPL